MTMRHTESESISRGNDPALTEETILVLGMTCSSCVRRVEKALASVPGVASAQVNFALGNAAITFDGSRTSVEALARVVEEAGYASPTRSHASIGSPRGAHGGRRSDERGDDDDGDGPGRPERANPRTPGATHERDAAAERAMKGDLVLSAALSLPVVALAMSHGAWPWAQGAASRSLQLVLSTIVVFGPGRRFFRGALAALRHRTADMTTLVSLGVGAAYLYSAIVVLFPALFPHAEHGVMPHVYFEAAVATVSFVLLGKWLEGGARRRLGEAVHGLAALVPETARVVTPRGVEDVRVDAVRPGDHLEVRPGERVPADGVIVEGRTAIDESMLTGESLPVDKSPGDRVHGGTLNQLGAVRFVADRTGADTAVAGIARAVEAAQGSRAPIARLADEISARFVPVVLAIAVAAFAVWFALDPSADGLAVAMERFVAVLVIACPCALGLATPAAVAVGTGRAAELGVLVKGGSVLETFSRIDTVFVDKTGTLTMGRPVLESVVNVSASSNAEVLALVAAAESTSEHPVARAVVDGARELGIAIPKAEAFSSEPGYGIAATVGGRAVRVGTARWLARAGVDASRLEPEAERLAAAGRSAILVAIDGAPAAVIAVADSIRREAAEVVRELGAVGVEVIMLTGDRPGAARAVAASLGIEDVIAGVRPEDKARYVAEARERGRVVAMVGDGINDAPALAAADVGVAMGSGTDIARAAADVALLSGGIAKLPSALRLARATLSTIRRNLFWAFAYNAVGIPLAAGALYPVTGWLLSPVVASAAMSLSSVSVLMSSLALRGHGKKNGPARGAWAEQRHVAWRT